jgi:hypothetical protein
MFPIASTGRLQGLFIQSDQRRMSTALLVAVLLHAVLLSVTFGGQTFGLSGFKLPWKQKRLGADELQVMLAPLPRLPVKEANPVLASEDVATIGSTVSSPSISPIAAPAPMPKPAAASAPAAAVEPVVSASRQAIAALPIAPVPQRSPTHLNDTPTPSTARDVAQPALEQATRDRVALDQAGVEREKQLAENLKQAELMAAAQREAARQELLRVEAARAEQAARDEAARLAAAKLEQEKAEALRQEAARNEALQREQAKQAQLELQRQERIRQETVREEQAKQAQQEAQRREAARQEQARQAENARQAAAKQEQERADAARQEAARQEQAKRELALSEKARQEAEREERLKAIGRQLNLEAAQRDAASRSPLPAASALRRGWLFGRADPNGDLVLYAESMSRKIEKNMTFEMIRDVIKQPHNRPTVTIAVRSDGTVEKVSFVTSSGVAAIDDAIRKIIASQAPFGAFPPALARQYDVIEIRRTWIFDVAVRLE